MDPHFDQNEAEEHHEPSGGTHQKRKNDGHRKPKGILKNSNPNATYHKQRHHRRKLDELVENERPEIIPTHTHVHGRHRHHHEQHHKHSHRHHHQDSATQWAIFTRNFWALTAIVFGGFFLLSFCVSTSIVQL